MRQFYGHLEKCVLSAGKTHVHKIPRFRGGGYFGFGGGSADFIFMGARIFLTKKIVVTNFRQIWGSGHFRMLEGARGSASIVLKPQVPELAMASSSSTLRI